MVEPVEVIQADREAAIALFKAEWDEKFGGAQYIWMREVEASIRSGENDAHYRLQIFARHRLSSAPASVEGMREALKTSKSDDLSAAVERMRADSFPDDAHLLGTTQQDERMRHYARAALASAVQGEG